MRDSGLGRLVMVLQVAATAATACALAISLAVLRRAWGDSRRAVLQQDVTSRATCGDLLSERGRSIALRPREISRCGNANSAPGPFGNLGEGDAESRASQGLHQRRVLCVKGTRLVDNGRIGFLGVGGQLL